MSAPKGNQNAKGNKGGRPSSFKPEYVELTYKFCLLGATDEQLAHLFNVSLDTIYHWSKNKLEFSDAKRWGKEIADAEVAFSLFHNAKGYSHPDVDIRVVEGKIVQTPITRHYPPNATSGIFWLKNRQPKLFRDKQEVENTLTGQIHLHIDEQDAAIGNEQ